MANNATFTTPNDYWKLEKYDGISVKDMKSMLDQRGYYNKSIKNKDDLRRALRRCDMGLVSYMNFTNDELRCLIHKRGIDTNIISGPNGTRTELIEALESEDKHPRFAGFTRLPAEVRNRIYQYYFADFKQSLQAPKQPPVALVSSLLRNETLPLFYSTCTFDFNLCVDKKGAHGWKDLKMSPDTLMWLHSTGKDNLAEIGHVRIRVGLTTIERNVMQVVWGRMIPELDFHLDRYGPAEVMKMSVARVRSSWGDCERLRMNVLSAWCTISIKNDSDKLTKDHFFALRRAIELSSN